MKDLPALKKLNDDAAKKECEEKGVPLPVWPGDEPTIAGCECFACRMRRRDDDRQTN